MPEPAEGEGVAALAEHLDRFALYRMRSLPWRPSSRTRSSIPRATPSRRLQVFHLAREARPYDEEFLLAALLHDVGKALDATQSRRGWRGPCAVPSPSGRSG